MQGGRRDLILIVRRSMCLRGGGREGGEGGGEGGQEGGEGGGRCGKPHIWEG